MRSPPAELPSPLNDGHQQEAEVASVLSTARPRSLEVVVLFNCELLDSDLRAVLLTRLGQLLNAAVKDRANSF